MSQQNVDHDHELDLAERRYARMKKQRDEARVERDQWQAQAVAGMKERAFVADALGWEDTRPDEDTFHLPPGEDVATKARSIIRDNESLRKALAEMVKWDSALLPTPLYVVKAARDLLAPTSESETTE